MSSAGGAACRHGDAEYDGNAGYPRVRCARHRITITRAATGYAVRDDAQAFALPVLDFRPRSDRYGKRSVVGVT